MSTVRILFSTGSLYVLDLARCFALAAEAGCDGIEVLCDERWSSRDPVYLHTLSTQYRLPIPVVHAPFSFRLPGWSQPGDQMARIRHSLQLAEALQAETLVVHLPNAVGIALLQLPTRRMPLPWKTPFNPVRAWIREQLAMTQRQTSVKIALENLPGRRIAGRRFNLTHWNTPAKWSAVHQWLTLDTTHWATLGVDPLAAYGAARKRVCHVHLSNYDGREHRLPHRGRLDLDLLLRTMAKDGYSGTMCLELHPDALEFQDGAACRRNLCDSVQFCREHLGQG